VAVRNHSAGVDPIVGDEFCKRLPRPAKDEVMQFNDWESRLDFPTRADTNGHLAFDREIGVRIVLQHFTGIPDFTAEKTGVDRTAHAELLDHAGPDAADFVSHDGVAGRTAQTRNFHLNGVGLVQR
jgi:hypothetical protein